MDNNIFPPHPFRERKAGIPEIQTQVIEICKRMDNFHVKINVQN